MKNVVITGATSFIATHLMAILDPQKYKIYAVVRENSANLHKLTQFKNLEIVKLNLEDIINLPHYIKTKCDVFFHFAWNGTRGSTRDDRALQETNFKYSCAALQAAHKLGCTTFFTAGSQSEYGKQDQIVSEETECRPITEYGKNKLKFYLWAQEYCQKNQMRLFEPRYFSVYGPNDYDQTLVISSLTKLRKNEKLECSSGKQLWNFIYIKDAVAILVKLLESDLPGGIFNIASDDTKPLKEYILEMKEICHSTSEIVFGSNTPLGINPNITKLKTQLNWQDKYSFAEGIKEILLSMDVNVDEKNN